METAGNIYNAVIPPQVNNNFLGAANISVPNTNLNFDKLSEIKTDNYYISSRIIMAIEPKTTREHILSLYGHMTGIKKEIVKNKQDLKHIHEDVEKMGGKIDKFYWVLLVAAGTTTLFVIDLMVR